MFFSLRELFGFCAKGWSRFSRDIMVVNDCSHRESEWDRGCSGKSKERRQCHLRWTQHMGLALKYNMDPGTEWEGDNVDGLQPPPSHVNQSRGDLNGRCFLFCLSHSQFARFCNLCLHLLGQRKWMVSEKKKAYSGLKGLTRSYISQTWASWQQLSASPAATCSNSQGPSTYHFPLGGLTSSKSGLEEKPFRWVTSHCFLHCLCYWGATTRHV